MIFYPPSAWLNNQTSYYTNAARRQVFALYSLGWTALHQACMLGQLNTVMALLATGHYRVDTATELTLQTPLHACVSEYHNRFNTLVLKMLLSIDNR